MPRMRKYGESKTTRIMMATVPHVTSGSGLRKFQIDGFLLGRVYYVLDLRILGAGVSISFSMAFIIKISIIAGKKVKGKKKGNVRIS